MNNKPTYEELEKMVQELEIKALSHKPLEGGQRENEARISLAHDFADAGTWEWDLQTNDNFWSDKIWDLYEIEPHSCIPLIGYLMHPVDQ